MTSVSKIDSVNVYIPQSRPLYYFLYPPLLESIMFIRYPLSSSAPKRKAYIVSCLPTALNNVLFGTPLLQPSDTLNVLRRFTIHVFLQQKP